MLPCIHNKQIKAIEKYFPRMVFAVLIIPIYNLYFSIAYTVDVESDYTGRPPYVFVVNNC